MPALFPDATTERSKNFTAVCPTVRRQRFLADREHVNKALQTARIEGDGRVSTRSSDTAYSTTHAGQPVANPIDDAGNERRAAATVVPARRQSLPSAGRDVMWWRAAISADVSPTDERRGAAAETTWKLEVYDARRTASAPTRPTKQGRGAVFNCFWRGVDVTRVFCRQVLQTGNVFATPTSLNVNSIFNTTNLNNVNIFLFFQVN